VGATVHGSHRFTIYIYVTRGMQRAISNQWDAMLDALDDNHHQEANHAP
jgi:hypothetical protein